MSLSFPTHCPHCTELGVFIGPRKYYSPAWPLKCRDCGGFSYNREPGLAALDPYLDILMLVVVALAVCFQRVFIIPAFILVGLSALRWKVEERRPRPKRLYAVSVAESRRARLLDIALFATIVISLIALGEVCTRSD